MTKPIARDPIYRTRRLEGEVIEHCVRWYISYRLSYRDLVATCSVLPPVSRVRSLVQ
jgi:transposase-like protein